MSGWLLPIYQITIKNTPSLPSILSLRTYSYDLNDFMSFLDEMNPLEQCSKPCLFDNANRELWLRGGSINDLLDGPWKVTGLPRGGIESHELGSVHGWGRKLHVITSTAGRVIMWSPQHGKPRSFPPQGGLLGWPRKWGSMVDFAHRFQIRERSQGSSEVGIGVNVSKVGWCLFSTDHKSLGPSPQSPSPPKIATCTFEL